MKIRIYLFLVSLLTAVTAVKAQQVAVKTNLLYDLTATINLGVEARLADRWSLDVSGNYNNWAIRGHRWKHWFVQPEARYWLCESFSGHFFGLHAIGGQFNVGNFNLPIKLFGHDFRSLRNHRYQGWAVGAGVAYGYSWILSKHWNMEAELGIGWAHVNYDTFSCNSCSKKISNDRTFNYFGPTKAAVNLIYVF